MTVLYVEPGGRVCSGRLVAKERGTTLTTRAGETLGPREVLALLAPCHPTDDQRAALWRAIEEGYEVENA